MPADTVERVFDVIGDVHGCCDELADLLGVLGYERPATGRAPAHPGGRRAVFVGDLVDRGPRILDAVRVVGGMVAAGSALCVPGNHDLRLVRRLRGEAIPPTNGLDLTLAELGALPADRRTAAEAELVRFFAGLPSHLVLDGGRLVVAHAGLPEELQGRGGARAREVAVHGQTTDETDELGQRERLDWAAGYRGEAIVVWGHTPVDEPEWVNRTIDIDTGCVFGGRLTALRYPELELVAVPAGPLTRSGPWGRSPSAGRGG